MISIRTHFVVFIVALQALFIISCETLPKQNDDNSETTKNTISLNFHDNILELNPIKTSNRAEVFISDLVFDKFFNKDGTSSLIESHRFDSLNGTHFFDLHPNKTFHDGTPVDTKAIHDFFKYLIKNHFESEPVNSLFTSMEGFGIINWYREHLNLLDSVPNGFQQLDDRTFAIKLRTNQEQLLQWLRAAEFILFKQIGEAYIGSGPYVLENLNEDISAKLLKTAEADTQIETINLSFMKNDDLVYSEFFRGSLDLILFNPHKYMKSPKTERLNKILTSTYPQYQVRKTQRSILKYLQINHVKDSTLLKRLLFSINKDKSVISTPTDNVKKTTEQDSVEYEIKWYSEIPNDTNIYFTKIRGLTQTNIENLNPTEPHIVIKEMVAELVDTNDIKISNLLRNKSQKSDEYSVFLILDRFPEYVIYNNSLKGIEDKNSLSTMIRNAYYQNVKTY